MRHIVKNFTVFNKNCKYIGEEVCAGKIRLMKKFNVKPDDIHANPIVPSVSNKEVIADVLNSIKIGAEFDVICTRIGKHIDAWMINTQYIEVDKCFVFKLSEFADKFELCICDDDEYPCSSYMANYLDTTFRMIESHTGTTEIDVLAAFSEFVTSMYPHKGLQLLKDMKTRYHLDNLDDEKE